MDIHNSKNVVTGRIDAQGNVIVGDGNNMTVINLKEAAQYKALQDQLSKLDARLEKTKQRIVRHPDDEDYRDELQEISQERDTKQEEIDQLTREVLKLAEEFSRMPIASKRLRSAKQHFEAGEFDQARAVLDAEKMSSALEEAIQKETLGKQLQQQGSQERATLANEYLILARLTAIDFAHPDRFEKTKGYFKQSLKADRNFDNLFAYADFLQAHNQFSEVQPYYEEALAIIRALAQANPQTYLPAVATTLNNLAALQQDKNEFAQAKLAYQEALGIRRALAQNNSQIYLPAVALTLNNLAILQQANNEFTQAERSYQEALSIRRALAQTNPQTYLPDIAATLNNLATMQQDKIEFVQAERSYQEALSIRRTLAETNPQVYLPEVALTTVNMSIFYSQSVPDRSQSLAYAEEALRAALPFVEILPFAHNCALQALQVVEQWGRMTRHCWKKSLHPWNERISNENKNIR